MNRAWIPAGALAGVSVAGLIAMGPLLTDSLTTNAPFPSTIKTPTPASTAAFVPVSYSRGAVGQTNTAPAINSRGGRQAPTQVAVNAAPADAGQVGYRRNVTPATHTSTATTNVKPKPKATPAKKRASSIGSVGEANGDSGFAGGSSNKTGLGEQTSTPGNGP